jgi:RHH-type proline utilization regulon transcriptional repressor/proline dehydrogenase/delta 1-pyrroline-5-carboxylate dehydrogenase
VAPPPRWTRPCCTDDDPTTTTTLHARMNDLAAPTDPSPRAALAAVARRPEPELLPGLIAQARLGPDAAKDARALALRIAGGVRERVRGGGRAGRVQDLLQEFALSSQEGIALMCMAEALLRIPDTATRDALIRDKLGNGDWRAHLGHSPSPFVNAAAWGLVLTGRLVSTHSDAGLGAALRRVVARGGEPLIRRGVDMAMRLMGEQFVTGETIDEALRRARAREAQGFRYSYDMLGEAAMTAGDADGYLREYERAIDAIGRASAGRGIVHGPGISIKLSALHPRYARAQRGRVMAELYPRLLGLALRARRHDIGLNVDAEESDRLELSIDLLERLCFEPALAGWNGVGFVIQAYQKRCPAVVDLLVDVARRSGRRLMVRLVKGAYWDGEIKRAQLDGLDGYPVHTRKAHTDVAYLACARRLLAAPDAIWPQFATHNAQTLAAVHAMAGGVEAPADRYEFQCLHGMGEPLYEQVVAPVSEGGLARPCRIYAPVGTHDTLLAYLVRRLLENGANTSFVNRIADPSVPLEVLVEDPVETVEAAAAREGALGAPHPAIPLPRALYGPGRENSLGLDLADEATLAAIDAALEASSREPVHAEPLVVRGGVPGEAAGSAEGGGPRPARGIANPSDRRDRVGTVLDATVSDVEAALRAALDAAPGWAATPAADRAAALARAATLLEGRTLPLVALLVREAGKTRANAVAEVREAVDFLRFDAMQLRAGFDAATHAPLGPVACISPWNFPLAIFVGQVAAALAAGNPVLAKPAEQTPLVACEAVRALHEAGVPRGALQLLPGPGETVGAALVGDARVQGVLFTGSTGVARLLQRTLAKRLDARGRPVTLVAETGGQNAMVVDSSALPEQVVGDVLASAFDSAGQRCSALRVLCVQRDAADRLVAMLEGAMRELAVGDPRRLATDVGPVIDDDARASIERHLAAMAARGRRIARPAQPDEDASRHGTFVAPALVEIDDVAELEREVFGPVLHVLRWDRGTLDTVLDAVERTGYGLTFGVHTRIDETVAQAIRGSRAGNVYVNRNVVGAVVGVQPFGGEGLSGTGPKAGGPLYLLRLLSRRPDNAARRAVLAAGPAAEPIPRGLPAATPSAEAGDALRALAERAAREGDAALADACARFAATSPVAGWRRLAGPTGQADVYAAMPRDAVLCLAERDDDRLVQLAAVLAVGARAVWPASAATLRDRFPDAVRERIAIARDWRAEGVGFDAVLVHGDADAVRSACEALAERPGPIVGVIALAPGEADVPLERLVVERSISVNTAAAGGNASLMTIG